MKIPSDILPILDREAIEDYGRPYRDLDRKAKEDVRFCLHDTITRHHGMPYCRDDHLTLAQLCAALRVYPIPERPEDV